LEVFNLLQFDMDADYYHVKNDLLQECDYSIEAAGDQLFNPNLRTLREKTASDVALYIERVYKRMIGDATFIEVYIHNLTYIMARQWMMMRGKDSWMPGRYERK